MKSFLLLLAALVVVAQAKPYEGQSVVRVRYTPTLLPWLRQMVQHLSLDVWSDARSQKYMDLRLPADVKDAFMRRTQQKGLQLDVLIEDVQALVDEQFAAIKSRAPSQGREIDSTRYRTLTELNAELDQLEQDFPSLASSYIIGTTYEGRDLRVVQLSSGGSGSRPAIWIDCGIHAREWVSPATCMYFLDQLTAQYGVDSELTALLDTYDFHILPVTNPDGYEYTWSDERLWRKNRVPYGSCYGADCNRNFDSNFGGEGSSDLPCSETYHGPSAFSEAESSAVRDGSSALGSRLAGFYTIHSYSQLWMTPYGYTHNLPADYDEQMRVAGIGVAALTDLYGTNYDYGNIADIIYVASGGSNDWAYDTLGVVYAYALELRDTGTYGFLLPENQILPTAEETFAGIVASIQAYP